MLDAFIFKRFMMKEKVRKAEEPENFLEKSKGMNTYAVPTSTVPL